MTTTRRDFLKAAATLSGGAALSGVVPGSIKRAFAIEPAPGSTFMDAQHIVILMQENRSFDHALGTLQGVRGFNDPRAPRQANGNSAFVQTNAAGTSYTPWRLDIKDTRVTWMGSVPHSRDSQVDAWNQGGQDRWLDAKRPYRHDYAHIPLTMGHYTREDLPFYYSLADAFTVCDQNYSSAMTSTSPNRSFFWSGTVREEQHPGSKVHMRNDSILAGGMSWKTFPERLQQAGIPWKFYQNELSTRGGFTEEQDAWLSNYGCNLLEYFAAYNIEAYPGSKAGFEEELASVQKQMARRSKQLETTEDTEKAQELRTRIESDKRRIASIESSLSNCGEARLRDMTPQQRALHQAAFITNLGDPHYHALEAIDFQDQGKTQQMNVPKGDILFEFRKDVSEGKLPAISWLSAPQQFSDHPSSPWYGAWYVSEVMDILTHNPEVWKKTIFILTYDENDGYFDHAPAYVAADPARPETGGASAGLSTELEYTSAADEIILGVSAKEARSGPIGLGFRVPMIVASPWSRGGWVNSQLFDHTSTLAFLEHFVQRKYGKTVREANISAWRRAFCGDLTSCFRPFDGEQLKLGFLERDQFVIVIEQARYKEIPSHFTPLTEEQIKSVNSDPLSSEWTAHQEPGIRPSCALPSEFYADSALTADLKTLELRLAAGKQIHASRSTGAPFNVYLRNLAGQSNATNTTVATYAVAAGNHVIASFPLSLFRDGEYAIDVHGPNGFYREFRGGVTDPIAQVSMRYEREASRWTGNPEIVLSNPNGSALTIAIRSNAYKSIAESKVIEPKSEIKIAIDTGDSHGWYDFTVSSPDNSVRARYAGRVETGRDGFTDPLMGRVTPATAS
jgi:phospholipase C